MLEEGQSVPTHVQLLRPTLEVLKAKGGSSSIDEIEEAVGDFLKLPANIREMPHGDGPRTKLGYRLAWARTYLKNVGALENSERGVWALTTLGRNMTEEQLADVPRQVRLGKRRKSLEESTDDEEVASDEVSWKDQLLAVLTVMPSDAFERLCQRVLRESGFTKVEVTGRGADGGIDGTGVLRMNLLSFQVIFQSKRYNGSVGASVIRDFRGAMVGRADKGLVITTGTFTSEARKEATRDGAPAIDLVDGDDLCQLLKRLGIGISVELVEKISIDEDAFRHF